MKLYYKAKFLYSFKFSFKSKINIILTVFGGSKTHYAGFLNTEGVLVEMNLLDTLRQLLTPIF